MEYEIRPKEKFDTGLRELWQQRELLYFFTWRDIKVKYKQTVLGIAWAVLQPLLLMLLFTLVFGRMLQVTTNIPYPVFAYSGLILWNIFSTGITSSGNSMVSNAGIIKKIYFPRLIIPVSGVIVSLFDFLMTLPFFLAVLVWQKCLPGAQAWLSFPLGVLMITIATIGPGCLLAALNVKYRDFRYIIPFLIQVLMFAAPVIYPVTYASSPVVRWLSALNPVSGALNVFRSGFTGCAVDYPAVLISLSSSLVLLAGGVYYFRKTESYFADLA